MNEEAVKKTLGWKTLSESLNDLTGKTATNETNEKIATATNESNERIAQMNIDYQNEFNNKIWEREDTALQRKLEDSLTSGINILSDVNGADAGGTASAPQSTMQYQGYTVDKDAGPTMANALSTIIGMSNGIDTMMTNKATREGIKADNIRKGIENDYLNQEKKLGMLKTIEEINNLQKTGALTDTQRDSLIKKTVAELEKISAETTSIIDENGRANKRLNLDTKKFENENERENERLKIEKDENHREKITNKIQDDILESNLEVLKRTQNDQIEKAKLQNDFLKADTNYKRASVIKTWLQSGQIISSEARQWIETLQRSERAKLFTQEELKNLEFKNSSLWEDIIAKMGKN